VAGTSINLTFRLLDTGPLKSALAGSPGVLALVTSSWFFEEVVRHRPAAHPTAYRPVRLTVEETDAVGWAHLPDNPYPPRDPTLKDPPLGGLTTAAPHQLPADTSHFVGRAEELRQLSTLLDSTTEDGATVVISAVSGTARVVLSTRSTKRRATTTESDWEGSLQERSLFDRTVQRQPVTAPTALCGNRGTTRRV